MAPRGLTRLAAALAAAVVCGGLTAGASASAATAPEQATAPSGAQSATTAAPAWGVVQEVPGLAALGGGSLQALSCASAGDCSGGGSYYDASAGGYEGMVVSKVNGAWGYATKVPGLQALNTGKDALVTSVSCAPGGNCAAVGYYWAGFRQPFVADQVKGNWQNAKEVPGIATLSSSQYAVLTTVSCTAPGSTGGNCTAGGWYRDNSTSAPSLQGFVVSEVNGTWGRARQVPGLASLNAGGYAEVTGVSCASPGDCAAIGFYHDSSGHQHAFAVSKVKGTWGSAQHIPAPGAGTGLDILSLSCGSPGDCSAGGSYSDGTVTHTPAFVVSEVNGTWGSAQPVHIPASLNPSGAATVFQVSCAPGSPGDCGAGGYYADTSGGDHAFVVDEVGGAWGTAQQVPGLAALNAGQHAEVYAISCPAAGSCDALGSYRGSSRTRQFAVNETDGTWGKPQTLAGFSALGVSSGLLHVSCGSAANCTAYGSSGVVASQPAPLAVANASLPPGTAGTAYRATLEAGGGVFPYTWSLAPGSTLPAGLTLSAVTGQVTGTPSRATTATVTFQVSDSASPPASATRTLQIDIGLALAVTTASLPAGRVGAAYHATLHAAGGVLPYTWSLAPGSTLPAGLTLSAVTGQITGTPTRAATATVTVDVSDSASPAVTVSRSLPVSIHPRRQADLNISLHRQDVFRRHRNARYRVRVVNAGNATATRERAVIHLPRGMTRPHPYGRGWRCRRHGRTIICIHRGHLRPHHHTTFHLRIHITARKGRRLTTTARVTPAGSDTNNTATNTVRIR